ncbi:putative Nucleotide-binding, alpha-beta plait, RNA recognition motif domain protein [Pseudoloma neurophilia]|uniref:Putative Nucleotide-binding, alpha-beta plait, RNA recognition motif domain protein n=1 Tax=Pseudoloma neurophilia TaxID=146866 RepID=A0A0R0LRB3_9MICR|nr:putative Nucleotide-binding, alpha-beta plait, RNA recognition motif domain protein [Pseudoloma neurophilia]
MTLLVKKVPAQLTFNNLYDYFAKYGRINELRLIDDTATLQFDSFIAERDAFHDLHEVNGFKLLVEKDVQFDGCNGQCPTHCGKKTENYSKERNFDRSAHPNDINKIVIENIPVCNPLELKDFVRDLNLDPVYSRITNSGKFGIIEFRSIEAKNIALKELEGVNFKNHTLTVRPYFNRERRDYGGSSARREHGSRYNRDESMPKEEYGEKTEKCDDLRDWNRNIAGNNNA